MIEEETISSFLIIGTAIFFLPFFVLLLSSIFFSLGCAILPVIFIISFLAALFYCLALSKILLPQKNISYFLYIVIGFSSIIFLSCLILSIFYDISYDGQWYHQYAIYHLANGWNPFYNPIKVAEWPVKYYSKGAWIYAASIYKLTNHIEASKAFNIAFIFGSLLTSAAAILSIRKLKVGQALLISLITAFNPISIFQSLSFYVDGQLSSLLVALTSLLFLSVTSEKLFTLFLGNLLLFVALLNICLVGAVYIGGNIIATFKVNVFLSELSNIKTSEVILDRGSIAPQIRLGENNIKYKLVGNDSLPCQNLLQFPYTFGNRKTSYCLITK